MRNLYLYSLIPLAVIAIGSLYRTIILGMFKQVFYLVTYSNSKIENEVPKRQVDWISLLSCDLSAFPLAANPFPLFMASK